MKCIFIFFSIVQRDRVYNVANLRSDFMSGSPSFLIVCPVFSGGGYGPEFVTHFHISSIIFIIHLVPALYFKIMF